MTSSHIATRQLLRNKWDSSQEYTIHLFEKCNLECSFCWQDHRARDGIESVIERAIQITELLDQEPARHVTFNVMGGEVFDDSIFNDRLQLDYIQFAQIINDHAESLGKQVRIVFVSNLVTHQPQRVRRLIEVIRNDGIDCRLSTSYDSKGRFKPQQLALFKENVSALADLIDGVSMLMTLPVMRSIQSGKDEYFDLLYKAYGFEIYFDYYTPTTGWVDTPLSGTTLAESIAPSDVELLKFFEFMLEHYPRTQPFKGWLENSSNPLSCRDTKLLLADGTVCGCGQLHKTSTSIIQFYQGPIHDRDNIAIQDNFVTRQGCASCEHFDRCQLGCFMQQDYLDRERLSECLYRLIFNKIVYGEPIDYGRLSIHHGSGAASGGLLQKARGCHRGDVTAQTLQFSPPSENQRQGS